MIYLNETQLTEFYGTPYGGIATTWFNATRASHHRDDAYDYNFGFINGLCVYAFIKRNPTARATQTIQIAEAQGLRLLTGKGEWKLQFAYSPDKNPKEYQEYLNDPQNDLHYEYQPSAADLYKTPLICVHQKERTQLIIYHPKWRPSLDELRKS